MGFRKGKGRNRKGRGKTTIYKQQIHVESTTVNTIGRTFLKTQGAILLRVVTAGGLTEIFVILEDVTEIFVEEIAEDMTRKKLESATQ